MTVLKRRRAVERWKASHREYYLAQKRQLASRSEYLAHRRAVYAAQQAELREAGIIPRRRGRPQMYAGDDAVERRRERARINSARYREKLRSTDQALFSHVIKTDEFEIETPSEDCSGCSD